jgi:hypothetical protein
LGVYQEKLATSELFSACLDELKRKPRHDSVRGLATKMSDVEGGLLDYEPKCVGLGQIVAAVHRNWFYDDPTSRASYGRQQMQIMMRTLQEWFRLHGFLMHQGVEQYHQEDVILRETTSAASSAPTGVSPKAGPGPVDLISTFEGGIAAMLQMRLLQEILQTDEEGHPAWENDPRLGLSNGRCCTISSGPNPEDCEQVGPGCPSTMRCETSAEAHGDDRFLVYDPYFRHCVIDPTKLPDSDDIQNGFVPVMTDALTGFLRVVQSDLENALLESYVDGAGGETAAKRDALVRYGNAVRMVVQLEALSKRIYEMQSTSGSSGWVRPRWQNRWSSALSELHTQMNSVQSAALKLVTNANPLGVPDGDTPIFFGDVAGTNSRYFASSDYLLGTWAEPAVKGAQAALESARNAWLSARNSRVTTEENQAAHERRMDDIASAAGRSLRDACGGVVLDGKTIAPRDVVGTIAELGPVEASRFLSTCFIQGDQTCSLSNEIMQRCGTGLGTADCALERKQREMVQNARRKQFENQTARAELCRLDYVRANRPDLWGRFLRGTELKTALEGFMTGGERHFCDDCWQAPEGTVGCSPSECVTDCYAAHRDDLEASRRDEECYYRAADCESLARRTFAYAVREVDGSNCHNLFGQPPSPTSPEHGKRDKELDACGFADRLPPGCRDSVLGVCRHYDFYSTYSNASEKEAGEYLHDCLSRHVHSEAGALPPWTSTLRSSAWATSILDKSSLNVEVRRQYARLSVDDFYDGRLKRLRVSENGAPWKAATSACDLNGYSTPLPGFAVPKECLRGTLGSAYQSMVDAWAEAEAISTQLTTAIQDWQDALLACQAKWNLGSEAQAELANYLKHRSALMDAAGDLAVMKATIDGALGGPGRGDDPYSAVALTAFEGFKAYSFASMAEDIRRETTALDNQHALFTQKLSVQQQRIDCALTVKKAHNAIRPLREQIAARFDQCETASLKFDSARYSVQNEYETARAQLESEDRRKVGDLGHHYWYDEKVEAFGKAMAWAKQTTYLALRAVEFEFQESLDLRRKVVAAKHPNELADAVLSLQQVQASRAVNRRRPEEASVVLSLRDDILQITDRSKDGAGERNWTPAQRFKGRLWGEGYRVRDKTGKWLGQGIAFSLTEAGTLLNRCGERLWRVTATVQGDGLSPMAPGIPLLLLKRNTFYSQYCSGHGGGQLHQVNSVRPAGQLFTGVSGAPQESEGFSTAAVFPWFNVRRFDFYNVNYKNGASEELAGRGLYGDYILLFPKEILDETASPQFPLQNVEDVLLRLDYLSVDNLSAVSGSEPAETVAH